ncbi:DUF4169 family protein [Palleronia pelagia]|uniref:DUF4169 domain-containing protein n=1 Tax=Palleronia pelagia TaxID=387096 RepID=A0A1H8AEI1_9RHOB|nr:DUF4169 family protein [Palleronia pelagia]SEM68248.1 protein of unknown function [Palleronia pelagia]
MSDGPINLNKARKARKRADDKALADANAAKHGRSKAERVAEAARTDRARALLDGHKFTEDE